jgi:hypothetical protein
MAHGSFGPDGALAVYLVTTALDGATDNVTHLTMVAPPVLVMIVKQKHVSKNTAKVGVHVCHSGH